VHTPFDLSDGHVVSVFFIHTRRKEPFSMTTKPAKKSTPKKSRATKKSGRRFKAKPEGMKDRQHLIDVIQSGTGCTGIAARETMIALLGTITTSLKKNQRVQLAGFGTFTIAKRAARKGVNPRTGEAIKIKASKSVRFKAGRTLKNSV
jgi:DNA-binding protein HU-beta